MQDLTANFMKTFGQWDGLTYLSIPKPKDETELNTYKLRLKLCIEEKKIEKVKIFKIEGIQSQEWLEEKYKESLRGNSIKNNEVIINRLKR